MNNLMLTIDDAVKVASEYCDYDLRNEFEQKCWIRSSVKSGREELVGLIMDINPKEIASHVEHDNLKEWCETIQVSMQLALMKIKEEEE